MSGCGNAVGFIGLGAIGAELAGSLIDAGYRLAVYDTRPEAMDAIADRGARPCASPHELAATVAVALLSLPTPAVVHDVCRQLTGGDTLHTVVDLSTIGAIAAGESAATLAAAGIKHVDAPVSGGVAGARGRTLAIMVSGDADSLASVQPLLECFASRVFHVGNKPGQGQTAKLLNNLLSATAVAITAEAMTAGVRCGLEASTLLEVFNASSGRNTATVSKFPDQVLTRRFESGFRLALMEKDIKLCLEEATLHEVPMLLGGLVAQLWSLAATQCDIHADHTEIVRLYERWAGVELVSGAGDGYP